MRHGNGLLEADSNSGQQILRKLIAGQLDFEVVKLVEPSKLQVRGIIARAWHWLAMISADLEELGRCKHTFTVVTQLENDERLRKQQDITGVDLRDRIKDLHYSSLRVEHEEGWLLLRLCLCPDKLHLAKIITTVSDLLLVLLCIASFLSDTI